MGLWLLANRNSQLSTGVLYEGYFSVLELTLEHELIRIPEWLELRGNVSELFTRYHQFTTRHIGKVIPYMSIVLGVHDMYIGTAEKCLQPDFLFRSLATIMLALAARRFLSTTNV